MARLGVSKSCVDNEFADLKATLLTQELHKPRQTDEVSIRFRDEVLMAIDGRAVQNVVEQREVEMDEAWEAPNALVRCRVDLDAPDRCDVSEAICGEIYIKRVVRRTTNVALAAEPGDSQCKLVDSPRFLAGPTDHS